jgi:hypothetical protein
MPSQERTASHTSPKQNTTQAITLQQGWMKVESPEQKQMNEEDPRNSQEKQACHSIYLRK